MAWAISNNSKALNLDNITQISLEQDGQGNHCVNCYEKSGGFFVFYSAADERAAKKVFERLMKKLKVKEIKDYD